MKRILKVVFYGIVAYNEMEDWKKLLFLTVLFMTGLALCAWGRG